MRDRRLDLDRAKGIAILLVVAGHIVARESPAGLTWYDPLRYAVYRFHMPLFFYLSGTVAMLTGALLTPPAGFRRLAEKRAVRLLAPFLAVGLLILLGKLGAAAVTPVVDNRPEGLLGGLRDLFLTTARSPATSIWYLGVLFLATLAAVPLLWLGIGTSGLLALGLVLPFLDLPPIAYLDRFASHFVFFAAGAWVAQREATLLPLFTRAQPWWWALFLLLLAAAAAGWLDERWSLLLCGLAAIPAWHGLVRSAPVAGWQWPLALGRYSMAIYLFNTIAIGLAKAVLVAAGVPWTAQGFWLHGPLLLAAGLALPVALKAWALRPFPALDRATN